MNALFPISSDEDEDGEFGVLSVVATEGLGEDKSGTGLVLVKSKNDVVSFISSE
jgi:hypothetical protein